MVDCRLRRGSLAELPGLPPEPGRSGDTDGLERLRCLPTPSVACSTTGVGLTTGSGLSVDGALVRRVGLVRKSVPYSSPVVFVAVVAVVVTVVVVPTAAPRGLALLASGLGGWLAAEGKPAKRPSGEVPQLAVGGRGELGSEPCTGLRRGLDGEADTWRPLANVGLTGGAPPKMGDVAAVAVVTEPLEPTDECCERLPRPLLVPVELRASGEMAEQRRRECSPIESLRSLRRSRSAWLSSTVCDGSDDSSVGLAPCT